MNGTLQLAIAADQRAVTLAGVSAAAAIVLAAAGIASAATEGSLDVVAPLPGAVFSVALVLITAAGFFAYSVRPVDFFLSGYQPSKLSKSSDDVRWLKIYAIEDLQKRITHNGKVLDRNIKTLRLGLWLMALAVPVGALAFFLLNHPS